MWIDANQELLLVSVCAKKTGFTSNLTLPWADPDIENPQSSEMLCLQFYIIRSAKTIF